MLGTGRGSLNSQQRLAGIISKISTDAIRL